MRPLFFLLASIVIHFAVIAYAVLPLNIVPKTQLNNAEFTVRLVKKSLQPLVVNASQTDKNTQLKLKPAQIMPDANLNKDQAFPPDSKSATINKASNNQPVATGKTEPVAQAIDLAQAPQQAHYYAASQVDRRAMPQLSIDSSKLNSALSSGLPIKLRLYVNTFGRLVKVERIGVLDQDIPFVEQLEQQLYQLSFLPARRDGADVDSYMDIEFSLNPLAPLEP